MKAVSSARSGIPDDAARLAFRVDKQLGARADATPLRCSIAVSAPLPGAQFTGNPEIFRNLYEWEGP
jgi:hypothetical protein